MYTTISRRGILAFLPSLLLPRFATGKALAVSARVVDVTTYGADPTGGTDSSAAFNKAATAVGTGGGIVYVPPGGYLLKSSITLGRGITIRGEGSALSVLMIAHSQTALNFTFSQGGGHQDGAGTSVVEKIGFLPMVQGGIAIAMNAPYVSSSGWQTCRIEDVDFTRPSSAPTGFSTYLYLNNIWRSSFRNLDVSASIIPADGFFAFVTGQSIDNRFENCTVTGVQTMFGLSTPAAPNSAAPIQGMHIVDCVCRNVVTAIDSGLSLLNSFNVLGLFVSGC